MVRKRYILYFHYVFFTHHHKKKMLYSCSYPHWSTYSEFSVCATFFTMYPLHWTLNYIELTLNSINITKYSVTYTLYSIKCAPFTVSMQWAEVQKPQPPCLLHSHTMDTPVQYSVREKMWERIILVFNDFYLGKMIL